MGLAVPNFVAGPDFPSGSAALSWLDKLRDESGDSRKVVLPVVFEFADEYRLKTSAVYLGQGKQKPSAERLALRLDDSPMSEGLYCQVARLCPKEARVCVAWLEGLWGSPIASALTAFEENADKNHWFSVFKLQRVDSAEASASAIHVLVENS